MKIVIPGGSGQVGTVLARAYHAAGHDVVVLSRRPKPAPWRVAPWDGETLGDWRGEFEGADVVINLAGRSVNCRYGATNRRRIMDSRLRSTRVVSQAIAEAAQPPKLWLQASTATIYAHRYDAPHDEATGVIGGQEPGAPDTWRFSIDVATSWERVAQESLSPGVRQVVMRSAIIMSPDQGGAFDALLWLARLGVGGRIGDGRQYVSWIHEEDFVRAVLWLIDHETFSGPVNLASPNPLTNGDFMRDLRAAWGARVGLPTPEWLLEIGCALMRTESELVLKSRRVVPARLQSSGFEFQYPTWRAAAQELCDRWRAGVVNHDAPQDTPGKPGR